MAARIPALRHHKPSNKPVVAPSPVSVPVLMRELGNKSLRGVSEGGA